MASDEDRQHAERLRREYAQRLRLLELRAARHGDSVEPAVLIEIEGLRAAIAALDLTTAPALGPEVREIVQKHFDSDLDFLIAQIAELTRRMLATDGHINSLMALHHAAQTWRIAIADDVQALKEDRAHDNHERQRGQRWNRILLIAIVILVVLGLIARTLYL